MQLTIDEKNENQLLERTELKGKISFEGTTPSNSDVTQELAKQLSKDLSLIVVKNVYTEFSKQDAVFSAVVYKNQEAKDKAEKLTKHLKKKIAETKKAAEEKRKTEAEAKKAAEEAKKAEEAAAAEAKEPAEEGEQ